MQEEKKPEDVEEDLLDEEEDIGADEDIGDFDDADFDDLSWDEYDDESESDDEKSTDDSDKPASTAPAKKSFFSKHFNAIIIIVAVLGGGGFLYKKMGAPQTSPVYETDTSESSGTLDFSEEPQEQFAQIEEQETEEQPGGFLSNPEILDQDQESAAIIDEELPTEDDASLPMPTPINSAANIDVSMEEAIASPDTGVLTPLPDLDETQNQIHLASLDQPLEESTEVAVSIPAEQEILIEPEPELELTLEPAPENAQQQQVPPELYSRLETLEQDFHDSSRDLSQKITDTSNEINKLARTLTRLEKRIAKLADGQDSVPVTTSSQQDAAPQKTPQKPESESYQPPVKKERSASSQDTETTWKLRSAQPGKALISQKGSNDFKTVEVGDTVKGIGRIVSIATEDGKWVVKGTSGQINQ